MPLPTPRKGESRSKFISRCISTVMHKGEAKDNKQAAAMCFSQARRSRGRKSVRNQYQQFTVNWDFASARKEMLGGRPHRVVPMVMLVEGVHSGSQGPVLYTRDELKRTAKSWNHKPIVLNHPQVNGKYVSACSAKVLDMYKLGIVLNTKFDDQNLKQRAEAWLDEELLRTKAPDVLNSIEAVKPVPISTGLFTDVELGAGRWKDQNYIGVTTNHQPDHLALVPNQEGACSLAKGCGLLVNKETVSTQESTNMDKKALVDGIIANKDLDWTEEEREALMNLSEKRLQQIANPQPVANAQPTQKQEPAPTANQPCPCALVQPSQQQPVPQQQPAPVLNTQKKQMTTEDWMAQAPAEIQEMINNVRQQQEGHKAELITVILANERNQFTEDWLKSQSIDILQGLAQIAEKPAQAAPKPQPLYFGGGGSGPVRNAKQKVEVAPLEAPTINSLFPQIKQTNGAA